MNAPVVDTHAHVFVPGLPLAEVRRYAPSYEATVEHYLANLGEFGVSYGVLVQPSFLGTDNSFLVESMSQSPDRLRGIAVIDPAISTAELESLANAGVVGIRLNLTGLSVPDLRALEWNETLTWMAAKGWQVEINRSAADLPVLLEPLMERGIKVVLDHFGEPNPALGAADPAWQKVLELVSGADVWFKVSGFYRVTKPGTDWLPQVKGLVDALINSVGTSRMVWGSDWPHTQYEDTQSYGGTRQDFQALGLSAEVSDAVLSATAIDLFGFGALAN